ncbi:type II toxin-antitoxin system VapC family toxin [Neisseria sp. CCUG12390]|uniref:type II toxin-antitoxin system VapC family toxin n=1 Tax=Neisseria sp. CCUG12390 TaxID=3392035 RepID=UPI003A0FCC91
MADYLLDTNYLIYLADADADETKRKEILQDFAEKLQQDDSHFFLTPLIRYEVLRGVDWGNREKLQILSDILKQFESLDIKQDVADLAGELYRFDKFEAERTQSGRNLEKRKFDMFHFSTAQINHLEVLSKDGDLANIAALHQKMQDEKAV